MARAARRGRQARVLLLADDRRDHAATLLEHIDAIRTMSRHDVRLYNPRGIPRNRLLDLDEFDVVIVHYSLMILSESYLPTDLREAIGRFTGLKIQFIQDDYRQVEAMWRAMRALGIDVLYTLVPEREVERVWPPAALPGVHVETTLAGFVPAEAALLDVPPLDARPLDVGYRGRPLPAWIGRLGQEKKWIAEGFVEHAARYGLRTNIAWQEDARIYGDSWFEFISSCRVTLGTESGATITDFDGSLERRVAEYQQRHPDADFEQIHAALLRPYEGNVLMNVISPRIFEAIALRTGLVLFPGEYSGVLEADRHYIPLAKDFSNIDEVVARIRDTPSLDAMIRRAYDEVVGSGRFSYQAFVRGLDATIDARIGARRRLAGTPPVRFHAARAERALRTIEAQPTLQVRHVARAAASGRLVIRDPVVRRLAVRALRRPDALRAAGRRNLALDLLRLAVLRRANTGRLDVGEAFVVDAAVDREEGVLSLVSLAPTALDQPVRLASAPRLPLKVRWYHAAIGETFQVPLTKRRWATFPVDTNGASPTHDFVALEALSDELPHDVAAALAPFWAGDGNGPVTRTIRVETPPTTAPLLPLPLRLVLHPRFYGAKAAFVLDTLRRHPGARVLFDLARRRGSWGLARRAVAEIAKARALALAAAGLADDVAAVRVDRDEGELVFVSLREGEPRPPAVGAAPVERIVWDNSAVSAYISLCWEGTEVSFALRPEGRQEFPILSSLVREEPGALAAFAALVAGPPVAVDG